MPIADSSRRSFLTTLATLAAGGVAATPASACWFRRKSHRSAVWPQPIPVPPEPYPAPPGPESGRVRPNINAIGGQIASLRAGVAYMKSLPESDRRSWKFQANMHGTDGPASDALFNQCEHGTFLFLAWHRGYVYHFERILRWASGDPSLNLPYWDWSNYPSVPEPYRMPASPDNPLYEEARALNDGSAIRSAIVVDSLRNALDLSDFSAAEDVGFTWALEGSPHGAVHTAVGGAGGTMSRVETAANDPIFWLHHCNVDRLWDYWLNLGGGRANPSDPSFLDVEYTYADETGGTATHRVRDIVSSRGLGYRYDDVPNPAAVTAAAAVGMMLTPAMQTPQAVGQPVVAAASAPRDQPVSPSKPLGLKTETIKLRPVQRAVQATPAGVANAASPPALPSRTLLKIEGIEFDKIPDFTFGVYLNVPAGQEPSEATRDHLVGVVNFFGKDASHARVRAAHPGGHAGGHAAPVAARGDGGEFSQIFDATKIVARLRQSGQYKDGDELRIDLLPLVPEPPRGAEAVATRRVESSAQQANVRYRDVKLLVAP
jgi:hypothetical protein